MLATQQSSTFSDLQILYPKMQSKVLADGRTAARLKTLDGGFFLLTALAGGHSIDPRSTHVAARRYAVNSDPLGKEETISIPDLIEWMLEVWKCASRPKMVYDYYVNELGAAPPVEDLRQLSLDSPQGRKCRRVIDHAAAIISDIRDAFLDEARLFALDGLPSHKQNALAVAHAAVKILAIS